MRVVPPQGLGILEAPATLACLCSRGVLQHEVSLTTADAASLLLERQPAEVHDHGMNETQSVHVKLHHLRELLAIHLVLQASLDYYWIKLQLPQELRKLLGGEVVEVSISGNDHFDCSRAKWEHRSTLCTKLVIHVLM